MPTPTMTIRLPEDTRAALVTRAEREGVPLRTLIVTTLVRFAQGSFEMEVATVPVSDGGAVDTQRRADSKQARPVSVVRSGSDAAVSPIIAERDRRHLSPMVTPDRTDVRLGFTVSEAECEHPRDQLKRLSYATTCKLCGKRML